MSIPEGRMLLLDLTEFATRDQFVYSHRWRVNDFVMWDNRSTMHRERRFDPSEARDIRQTRLAGDGPTISRCLSFRAPARPIQLGRCRRERLPPWNR
jgi:alpha-ketoglutarate-dependent 2,4-dichlorophenoxyacetate dioxygenase